METSGSLNKVWDLAEIHTRHRWRRRPPEQFPHPRAKAWGFDPYGLWQRFIIAGEEFCMRYIPPGRFLMGSPETEAEREEDETQHLVVLAQGFWLGETTITQAIWRGIMGNNPSDFKKGDEKILPVDSVSWNDCREFFQKLKAHPQGLELTFASEAQWEYACRAGTQTPFSTGETMSTEQANYNGDFPYPNSELGKYREKPVAVKRFSPNAWGLYQMHGNVYEWCLDGIREFTESEETDPLGDLQSSRPVLRGGSWINDARLCRSAFRFAASRDFRYLNFGLRAAMVPQPRAGRSPSSE